MQLSPTPVWLSLCLYFFIGIFPVEGQRIAADSIPLTRPVIYPAGWTEIQGFATSEFPVISEEVIPGKLTPLDPSVRQAVAQPVPLVSTLSSSAFFSVQADTIGRPAFRRYPVKNSSHIPSSRVNMRTIGMQEGLHFGGMTCLAFAPDQTVWAGFSMGAGWLRGNEIWLMDAGSGLPEARISSIAVQQDQVWIGFFGGGLVCYRNDRLLLYDTRHGFPSDHITALAADSSGGLWIGTYGKGLLYMKDGKVREFAGANGAHDPYILSLDIAAGGDLWVSGMNNGLARIAAGRCEWYRPGGRMPGNIQDISTGEEGRLWLTTADSGLFLVERGQLFDYSRVTGTASGGYGSILAARSGNTWVATGNGLLMIGPRSFLLLDKSENKVFGKIGQLAQDRFNNLWVVSDKGEINMLVPSNFGPLDLVGDALPAASRALTCDENGRLYYELACGGIGILDNNTLTCLKNPVIRMLSGIMTDSRTGVIYFTSPAGFFVLSGKRLLQYYHPEDAGLNNHLSLSAGENGRMYIANYNRGLICFDGKGKFFQANENWLRAGNTLINSVFADAQQRLWLGSAKGGFSVLRNDSIFQYDSTAGFPAVRINSFTETADGEIFLSGPRGLFRYSEGRMQKFRLDAVLRSENIRSLVFDPGSKNVWCLGQDVLFSLARKNGAWQLQQQHATDGMLPGAGLMNAVAADRRGGVYWGTTDQIVRYWPFRFGINEIKPQLLLSEISLNGGSTDWPALSASGKAAFSGMDNTIPVSLTLPENAGLMKFSLNGIYWGHESALTYYYRIGENGEWIGPSGSPDFTLSDLEGGTHRVWFKAVSAETGQESNIVSYSFEIIIPFYKQSWFLAGLGVLLLGILFFIIARYSQFSFDKYNAFDSDAYRLIKVRSIGAIAAFSLPVIEYLDTVYWELYPSHWPVQLGFSVFGLLLVLLTFYRKIKPSLLNGAAVFLFFSLTVSALFRLFANGLNVYMMGECAVICFASIFVFDTLRWFMGYAVFLVSAAAAILVFSPADPAARYSFSMLFGEVLMIISVFFILDNHRKSKRKFSEKILERSEIFVLVTDAEGQVVYINPYTLKRLGYTAAELYGEGWSQNIRMSDRRTRAEFLADLKQQISTGDNSSFYLTISSRSGEAIAINWQNTVLDGRYMIGVGKDVTAETKQQEEIEKLSQVARNVNNGVLIISSDRKVEWCNAAFENLFGYSLAEIRQLVGSGSSSQDQEGMVSDERQQTIIDLLNSALLDNACSMEITLAGQNNAGGWYQLNCSAAGDHPGEEGQRHIVVITDVTARRKFQEEYRHIIQNSTDTIYRTDALGNLLFVNEAATELTGYAREELQAMNFGALVLPDDLPAVAAYHKEMLSKRRRDHYFEFRISRKNGQVIWVGQNIQSVFDPLDNNRIAGFQAVVRDITQQKYYEAELQRLSLVAERSTNMILITNAEGRIEWANDTFLKRTGYAMEEIAGRKPGSFLQGEATDAATRRRISQQLAARTSVREEVVNYDKAGNQYWAEIQIDPVFGKEGQLVNFISISQDITERKHTEMLISQQNKDIIDSIQYALTIQQSLLPGRKALQRIFPDMLLLNQPKNIIGGDFFWFAKKGEKLIVAVGDCTGHGVPGAFMTVLGNNALTSAVKSNGITDPAQILAHVDDFIKNAMRKKKDNMQSLDGMELAILTVVPSSLEIRFASARRPLLIRNNGELTLLQPTKRSIGDFYCIDQEFTTTVIPVHEPLNLYLFSDGYQDQFGGERGRRIGFKSFQSLVEQFGAEKLSDQETLFRDFLMEWRMVGNYAQTDDILLLGLGVSPQWMQSLKPARPVRKALAAGQSAG